MCALAVENFIFEFHWTIMCRTRRWNFCLQMCHVILGQKSWTKMLTIFLWVKTTQKPVLVYFFFYTIMLSPKSMWQEGRMQQNPKYRYWPTDGGDSGMRSSYSLMGIRITKKQCQLILSKIVNTVIDGIFYQGYFNILSTNSVMAVKLCNWLYSIQMVKIVSDV